MSVFELPQFFSAVTSHDPCIWIEDAVACVILPWWDVGRWETIVEESLPCLLDTNVFLNVEPRVMFKWKKSISLI